MKVSLNDENGIVLESSGYEVQGQELYGVIQWDTEKENDTEDWRGLFGSFIKAGGSVLSPEFELKFINEEVNRDKN